MNELDIRYAASLIAAAWYFVLTFGGFLVLADEMPTLRTVGGMIVFACILGFIWGY